MNIFLTTLQSLLNKLRSFSVRQLLILGICVTVIGKFNDVLQFIQILTATFFPTPQIMLRYEPHTERNAKAAFKLIYTVPSTGYVSLWNQMGDESSVRLFFPKQGTIRLHEGYQGETFEIVPTMAQGVDRYFLLWTPKPNEKQLPNVDYPNETAFKQAIETLKTKATDLELESVAIPMTNG